MAVKYLQINKIFKRILFYKRYKMRENSNKKKDEKDAAHCDRVCLNDFYSKLRSEGLESNNEGRQDANYQSSVV